MRAFVYQRPTSLADAISVLAERGSDAHPLAGGTDLTIRLRDRSIEPSLVLDLKRIAELDDAIRDDDRGRVIGARTSMTSIAADPGILRHHRALAEAAAVVGSVQIRNRATLAGNICNASPASDTAPALTSTAQQSSWRAWVASGGSPSTTSSSAPASPSSLATRS